MHSCFFWWPFPAASMLEAMKQVYRLLTKWYWHFHNWQTLSCEARLTLVTSDATQENGLKAEEGMLLAQLCLTLCNPLDCSPPGSSALSIGILQARILEWVATSFSRGSSQPRDRSWVSSIAGRFFTIWATCEAPEEGESPLKLPLCIIHNSHRNRYRKQP